MLRVIRLLGAVAAFAAIYVALDMNEDDPRQCPRCGTRRLAPVYQKGGPKVFRCEACGEEVVRD